MFLLGGFIISSFTCADCADWFGYCHSGERERRLKFNFIASGEACTDFRPRRVKEHF